jgi:MFS family permease
MGPLPRPNAALAPIRESLSNENLRLLFTGRALRSFSLGYLNVIVPIYLVSLGYSAVRVGLVYTAGSLGSMALTAAVGLMADRFGRKPLLIALGLFTGTAGLLFAISPSFGVLLFAAALGTIGRGGGAGSGGSFGPYFPAEQALIAEHAGDERRTAAFGVVSLIGVLAGAGGSLAATTPSLLHRIFGLGVVTGERALFALTAVLGIAMAVVILPVRELPRAPRQSGAPRLGPATRRMLPRFMLTNATNGIAVGMLGPVLVYWFHVRYGATSAELGTLYFLANIVAAPSNLLAPVFAKRLGAVSAVVSARSLAVLLLAAMALMPSFWLAGILLLLRTQVNTISGPIRQSFLMGVVDEEDRSTAAGISNLPLQALSSAGPVLAGQIMQSVALSLPILIAASLQAVNAALYYAFFRKVHPPEEL